MKEIIDELDLDNSQYAIQLKENNYLLWKFKKKWRVLAEMNFKYKIVKTEFKSTGRKKKVESPNEIKENIHYIKLFKSEKVYSLKSMNGSQLTSNESNLIVSI
jgi:hypothetical protein